MADSPTSTPHGPPRQQPAPADDDEDLVRTPMWLPLLGLALLVLGVMFSYLWIYPGKLSSVAGDGGTDGGTEASAQPAAAPPPAH